MSFYTYCQNNSGGDFDVDEEVAHYVIIEAPNADAADERAKEVGLYFDGEGDCECCGNRWSEAYEGSDSPRIYGEVAHTYKPICDQWGEVRIHYLTGKVEAFDRSNKS